MEQLERAADGYLRWLAVVGKMVELATMLSERNVALVDRLTRIEAEAEAELERVEEHGGTVRFAERVRAIAREGRDG